MTGYPLVALGEFLTLALDEVPVEPEVTYRTAGVYSFGRGLFARPPFLGAETKYRSLCRLRQGQFVLSRLNAWEGALAVVPGDFDGFFVSVEYPTFNINEAGAHPAFVSWLCRWPSLWEALRPRGSMVRRKRSHPDQVLQVPVPLPPLRDQRPVAAWLDSLDVKVTAARRTAESADVQTEAGWSATLTATFSSLRSEHSTVELAQAADANPESVDPRRVFADASFEYVDITAVGKRTGRIESTTRYIGHEAPSRARRRIRAGDVLVSTVRPNLRAFALVPRELDGQVCSTGFAVLRPQEGLDPKFLLYQVLSDPFVEQLTLSARGGHYPAVNDSVLRKARIVRPPLALQARVVRRLDSLRQRFEQLLAADRDRILHLRVLMPATLDRLLN